MNASEQNTTASLKPIFVAHLFPQISQHLIDLLSSLSVEEWHLPTVSSQRSVKDIASHLLDGSLRRLSMQRDGYFASDGTSVQQRPETLLDFLNRLNATWEIAMRRLSPRVLIDWIAEADRQMAQLFQSLDPFGPAIFPVAWAGEESSLNWMDIARDYTEKWHHTQQIFLATGRPSTITVRELFHPCLDIFMRALPFTYRSIDAAPETVIEVNITGAAGGSWYLSRNHHAWQLVDACSSPPASTVTLDEDTAWQLVTKRRPANVILAQFPNISITGDVALGSHVLEMVSVMA